MAPGHVYWISATQAITLRYPVTGITNTLPVTTLRTTRARLDPALEAELAAGVEPTYEWMNFYGVLALPDGTVVLAVVPQGAICGATATWEPGQYGLLACYADDPDTPADAGASLGDTIRLVVGEGSPPAPGGWVIGEGTWTAHGVRRQVPAGPPNELPYRSYLPLLLRGGRRASQDQSLHRRLAQHPVPESHQTTKKAPHARLTELRRPSPGGEGRRQAWHWHRKPIERLRPAWPLRR